jgi:hypothetical protein
LSHYVKNRRLFESFRKNQRAFQSFAVINNISYNNYSGAGNLSSVDVKMRIGGTEKLD